MKSKILSRNSFYLNLPVSISFWPVRRTNRQEMRANWCNKRWMALIKVSGWLELEPATFCTTQTRGRRSIQLSHVSLNSMYAHCVNNNIHTLMRYVIRVFFIGVHSKTLLHCIIRNTGELFLFRALKLLFS